MVGTPDPVVQLSHIQQAFAETAGSVSEADKLRYRRMYDAFTTGRPAGMGGGQSNRVALK